MEVALKTKTIHLRQGQQVEIGENVFVRVRKAGDGIRQCVEITFPDWVKVELSKRPVDATEAVAQ